jgi:hypothetical protein
MKQRPSCRRSLRHFTAARGNWVAGWKAAAETFGATLDGVDDGFKRNGGGEDGEDSMLGAAV